jgi:hypothetical protein
MASLASATSSRVDSASKHIVPCKVNTDYMISTMTLSASDAIRELQQNKMKYCMHKDDLVIGLGRPTYRTSVNMCNKKAYPSVITTVVGTNEHVMRWYAMNTFMVSEIDDIYEIKDGMTGILEGQKLDNLTDDIKVEVAKFKPSFQKVCIDVNNMLDLHFVGVSLGTAYAHSHSGDTVASVMVGGLKTVMNGAFQVHTNDLLMFYFDEEVSHFQETGGRKKRPEIDDDSILKVMKYLNKSTEYLSENENVFVEKSDAKRRKVYHRQQQGSYPGGGRAGKSNVAKIKPYIESTFGETFPNDKRRIFGRAISNAQPYEMVDIVLSRQSI